TSLMVCLPDAEGVVSKGEHRLQHVTVQVRRPPPWDPRKVVLSGLDLDTPEVLLELYVEAVSGRETFTIHRAADKTSALVSFQQELSEDGEHFQQLLTRAEKKPLQRHPVSACRVRACGDVLVENIGSQIPAELLEMYFESNRAGGGAVRSVTMLRMAAAAVVSFHDWNVADRVLCRQHTLHSCQLSVSPYYPELLGSPRNDITNERVMEEEDPTETPDTGTMQQNGSHGTGAPAEDCRMQSVPGIDEKMVGVGLCGMEETQAETREGTGMASVEAASPVHEAEVVMEAAELSFMQKYHHELLAGFDAVTIFPLEEEDRFGFKVVGDSFSCRTAVELLQHIVSSLSSRTVTLEYPWVSHFLLEGEGQRTLRDTEKHHQCIIDTSQISWNALDCVYIDPWSFVDDSTDTSPVQSMVTDEEPDNQLLQANMEGIKRFASLLKSEESPSDAPPTESSTTIGQNILREGTEEDLYTDSPLKDEDSTASAVKDEELDQVCQMSRKEYQDQELDEEAQLLLAIQRSMDTRGGPTQDNEDEELQRVLEMSLIQHENEDTEDSLQRALEMSLMKSQGRNQPIRTLREDPASSNDQTSNVAQIRVLAGDETSIVVATRALRKAITSKLNVVSLEETGIGQNMAQILAALEKKHKVKMTKSGRELQIHGFLHGPNQCRQEMSQIINALQARNQAKAEVMDVDIDVEMIDVPETSEEYQSVIQPFLRTLQDLKLSIEVLQVQRVNNPLLYNQYQLKKVRMVMTDPNKPAERILYHGTTETGAREICHSGFNRSFCGKNATLYGQGVYFALESEISTRDHYSPPNKDGKKFVLVSRVLTGDFTLGKEDMRTPPLMETTTGGAPRRYDSLVNNMKEPVIYVIFN
ncbi:PREDICTED: poly [ADP-ribose] polymerase 10, partial [Nanorana parkeri]|uniref:poly [ADP-ribose] polymerase 10 n=1 Tax=Nanorana parkeri TaxID=125878 RepID=UPI00085450F5